MVCVCSGSCAGVSISVLIIGASAVLMSQGRQSCFRRVSDGRSFFSFSDDRKKGKILASQNSPARLENSNAHAGRQRNEAGFFNPTGSRPCGGPYDCVTDTSGLYSMKGCNGARVANGRRSVGRVEVFRNDILQSALVIFCFRLVLLDLFRAPLVNGQQHLQGVHVI